MKKLYTLFFSSLFCLISCEKEHINSDEITLNNEFEINSEMEKGGVGGTFSYPSNQMIVQYDTTLSEAEKQQLRDQYGIDSYKNCTCADPTLELWIFSEGNGANSGIDLEEKILTANGEDDLEGVDFNPIFQHTGQKLQSSFGSEDVSVAINKTVSSNDNVTIAVLDTGVDYNYFGFSSPFLYNNSLNSDQCIDSGQQDYYGWDFVNQDNDPFDDYGHGTIVTSLIYNELQSQNVNFQILPIKTFDASGKGNYFDILCGFKYAVNKGDVDIVNMSFGWYNSGYDLLNRFINEAQEEFVINASAGNNSINTDFNVHYPSTFDSENIISVAALNNEPINLGLSWFSNYGTTTVDIAARGERIPFYLNMNEFITVQGTSFSCAYTSAFGGKVYDSGMSVNQHISTILSNTIQHDNLSGIKYASYIPY